MLKCQRQVLLVPTRARHLPHSNRPAPRPTLFRSPPRRIPLLVYAMLFHFILFLQFRYATPTSAPPLSYMLPMLCSFISFPLGIHNSPSLHPSFPILYSFTSGTPSLHDTPTLWETSMAICLTARTCSSEAPPRRALSRCQWIWRGVSTAMSVPTKTNDVSTWFRMSRWPYTDP